MHNIRALPSSYLIGKISCSFTDQIQLISIVLSNSIVWRCFPWYGKYSRNTLEIKLPYCGRDPVFPVFFPNAALIDELFSLRVKRDALFSGK